MKKYKTLVINPGSTSTKIAVYENEQCIFSENIVHSQKELSVFETIAAQYDFRKKAILSALENADISLTDIAIVMARGGLVKPIESGVYKVSDDLLRDLYRGVQGHHASNLGGIIAHDIAKNLPGVSAYIADPVVVDELQDVARLSGLPEMPRKSIFHALNQKSVARNYAESIEKKYEELNLIVAHLGGGITIGAHENGKVIDVNNGLDGVGPFSPERAGTLPCGTLVDMCFSGEFTRGEIRGKLTGRGGLMAHEGTNQLQEVRQRADNGDAHAALVLEAMAYQIGKFIGSAATVLHGNVDAIIVTGGMAFDKKLIASLKNRIDFIAPVIVMPGEDEMKALAENAFSLLMGKITPKKY